MVQRSKELRSKCFKQVFKECGPPAKNKKCASDFLKKCLNSGKKKK